VCIDALLRKTGIEVFEVSPGDTLAILPQWAPEF
jgi:hypothetical protein